LIAGSVFFHQKCLEQTYPIFPGYPDSNSRAMMEEMVMRKKFCLAVLVPLMAFAGYSVSYADLNDGLVAYYPFNGNANDESGNGLHGTVYGATLTQDRFGNAGKAYWFDGEDDYIKVSRFDFKNSSQRTITLWLKPERHKNNESRDFISKHSHEGNVALLLRTEQDGKYDLEWTIGGRFYDFTSDVTGQPNDAVGFIEPRYGHYDFYAAIYDGEKIWLYINGEYVKALHVKGDIAENALPLTIGAYAAKPSLENFKGIIDDICIYNRALSKEELQQLYAE